jgi:hypothetical protein
MYETTFNTHTNNGENYLSCIFIFTSPDSERQAKDSEQNGSKHAPALMVLNFFEQAI